MKILIVGFLVFLSWSALSTYVYVCKIKGLCYEMEPAGNGNVILAIPLTADTIPRELIQMQVPIPVNLSIFFGFDKSEFNSSPTALKYFEESMSYMLRNPDAGIKITGYTDSIGTNEYNIGLGSRRAKSIQNFFEKNGVPPIKIITASLGESDPSESNKTDAGRIMNRRSIVTITH